MRIRQEEIDCRESRGPDLPDVWRDGITTE